MEQKPLIHAISAAESFGAELFALRVSRGFSQAELARRALLSRSYLSEVENDRKPCPSLEVCWRLFDALELAQAERTVLLQLTAQEQVSGLPEEPDNLADLIGDLGRLHHRLTPDRIHKIRRHLLEVTA